MQPSVTLDEAGAGDVPALRRHAFLVRAGGVLVAARLFDRFPGRWEDGERSTGEGGG
jgi:hypothetical protein